MADESDNLDVRMEAIRLKNEELEKKHKEIMEDEELAKRENAVVDVNSGRDIPKHHPYDNIDLDFDVKDTDKELAKNPDYQPKNRRPMPRKDLLDEIPPDPVNFLREDGDDTSKVEPNQTQRPPNNKNRNYNNRNRQERPRPEKDNNDAEPNSGDSPSRPKNQNPRPRPPPNQQQNRSPQQQQNRSPPQQQQNRSSQGSTQDGSAGTRRPTHPQQLRNERRSVPQNNEPQMGQQGQQQHPHTPNRQRRPNNRPPNRDGGDRNNITVEITDGEVRSVKLKSSGRSYGTGRVGHARPDNDQKPFTVDTFNPDNSGNGTKDRPDRSPQDKPRHRNPRNRRNQKPKEFHHPTLENIIITKANVQDRLLKIAKDKLPEATQAAEPVTLASNVEANEGAWCRFGTVRLLRHLKGSLNRRNFTNGDGKQYFIRLGRDSTDVTFEQFL